MAQLAIKGHPTKGKEVIEILEMLGGKNEYKLKGCNIECAYYKKNGVIHNTSPVGFNNIKLLPLEEFLEKFPYKVGDKVQHKGATSCGTVYEVEKMRWEENTVKYTLRLFGCNYKTSTLPAEDLQPYKDETMDKAVFDANAQCCDIMNHLIKKETTEEKLTAQDIRDNNAEWLLNKLQEMSYESALQTINDLYDELHTPKYPKTYEECCKVLFPNSIALGKILTSGYNCELLKKLGELLICRKAYWKIVGEQMGLGKPWEPDWSNLSVTSHEFIKINNGRFIYSSRVLVFPTVEMRDAFYENFKDLIEQCKELL